MVVGIVEHCAPHLLRIELLNAHDVILVVVVQVEVRAVVVAVLQNDQYQVVVVELAEILPVVVVVQSVYIRIPPHLQTAKRRVSETLQRYTVNRILRQDVSLHAATLDEYVGERTFHEQLLVLALGLQDRVEGNLDDLRLTIRVGGEV